MQPVASDKLAEQTKSACIKDGAMSFAMTGIGESYVVPAAIALGAAGPIVLLVSSLPRFCGSLLQVLTSSLSCKIRSKKQFVFLTASLQVLVWVLFAALFYFAFGWQNAIISVFGLFCLYFFLNFASNPSWASWVSEFVSQKERGSFFAKRNRISIFFMVGAMLLGAAILDHLQAELALAFAILFLFAAIFRVLSSRYILQMHEAPSNEVCVCGHEQILDIFKTPKFVDERLFLFYIASIMAATYVAAPIFDLYMLTGLGFSYITWSIIKFAGIISKPLFLPYWGQIMDTYGVRPVLYACGVLIPLVPLLWVFTTNPFLLFGIEIISGMAWGGFELAAFGATIGFGDVRQRAIMTSAYNMFHGFGLLCGALVGSALFALWPKDSISVFVGILVISAVLRFIANSVFLSQFSKGYFSKVSASEIIWQVMLVRPTREVRSVANYCIYASKESFDKVRKKIVLR